MSGGIMSGLLFSLAAMAQVAMSGVSGASLQDVSASLKGKPQCIAFNWMSDGENAPRTAISVDVPINGKTIPLQLDTGSNATILYGRVAERAGWAAVGQEKFHAAAIAIGSTVIDRPTIYIATDMDEDTKLLGTLGLSELMGRITVIDYPQQRFCLFSEADLPATLSNITYVWANLRNAKIFVPIAMDKFRSDAVVFDTGSSAIPLSVDLTTWKQVTGYSSVAGAPAVIKGSAWGKPVTLSGAPAAGSMMLGKLNLGRPTIFTNGDQPTTYADWPFRADGVLGNASLWDGIVILDLTARVRFGFVR